MAFRPPTPALLLSLAALLAGCADSFDPQSITVRQAEEVDQASGPDGETGSCDGDGTLTYTLTRRAGTVRILVADQSGALLHDSGSLDAAPDGFASGSMDQVEGTPGTWTLSVEREGFTGSYTVSLAC